MSDATTASPLVAGLTSAAVMTSESGSIATWALPVGHPPVNWEIFALHGSSWQLTRQPTAEVNGGLVGPSRRGRSAAEAVAADQGLAQPGGGGAKVTSHGRHLRFGLAGDGEGSRVRTPSLTLVLGSSGFRRRDG